jgi:hypothetical protein
LLLDYGLKFPILEDLIDALEEVAVWLEGKMPSKRAAITAT